MVLALHKACEFLLTSTSHGRLFERGLRGGVAPPSAYKAAVVQRIPTTPRRLPSSPRRNTMSRQPYQLYPYTPGGYSYPRAASPAATRTWVSQVITPFDEEPLFIPPIPTPSPPPSLPLSYHTQPGPRGHLAHVGSQDPALPYQYAAQPLPSQRGAPSSSYSMYERTTYGPSHSAPSTDPSVMLVDWIENRISDDAVMTATSRVLNSPKSMRFRFTVAGSDGEWRIVAQWAERVPFPLGICDRVQLELSTSLFMLAVLGQ